jgi:hypothetical protein
MAPIFTAIDNIGSKEENDPHVTDDRDQRDEAEDRRHEAESSHRAIDDRPPSIRGGPLEQPEPKGGRGARHVTGPPVR